MNAGMPRNEHHKAGGKAISDLLEGGAGETFVWRSLGWATVCGIF